MKVSKKLYGYLRNKEVYEYTLTNSNNLSLSVITYGAIISSIKMPDRDGNIEEITVNLEDLDEIVKHRYFHGAIIGPVAGRISGAEYIDNKKIIKLDKNEGENTLHSGFDGLDTQIWDIIIDKLNNKITLVLETLLENNLGGFPGNVRVRVFYTLNEFGEIIINYEAETDQRTLFNPTNHVYFNLSGNSEKAIYKHELKINSNYYAVLDKENIPTGELKRVDGSVFDFRKSKNLELLKNISEETIQKFGGIDHPFLLEADSDKFAASLYDKKSGRFLKMRTDNDSVVIFTHNQELKTDSKTIKQHSGIALETSKLPDAVNQENFGSIWLEKDVKFKSKTIFKLMVK